MATIKRFEDLEIWQKARILCNKIYLLIISDKFSKDYKLVSQINRSSGSIMDNIAEGFGRAGKKEFIQFLSISKASCDETKSQLYRALDREYITLMQFQECYNLADEISAQQGRFINYLNHSEIKGLKYKDRVAESEETYSKETFNLPF